MGSGLRIVLVGAVVGVVAAGILGRALESVLFGVTPFDPLTFLVVPILLVAVACVACYLPGRRASSVDPIIALHQD